MYDYELLCSMLTWRVFTLGDCAGIAIGTAKRADSEPSMPEDVTLAEAFNCASRMGISSLSVMQSVCFRASDFFQTSDFDILSLYAQLPRDRILQDLFGDLAPVC